MQTYTTLPNKNLKRIVKFAQGFPQMAVLIADAHLEDEKHLAELKDGDLLKRWIWGRGEFDMLGHTILQYCSLFREIGWKNELRSEYEYIADQLGIQPMQIYSYLQAFQHKEILQEQHENYLQVVPKPLAIRLAAD